MVAVNGDIVQQGSQFAIKEIDVVVATIDLEVRSVKVSILSTQLMVIALRFKAVRRSQFFTINN